MHEENKVHLTEEDMIKKGLINVMALGYKGVELWRAKREPLKKVKKIDEKKS